MSNTEKSPSQLDGVQTLQASFNDVDASLGISGFLISIVGRKIDVTYPSSDVEVYAFSENGTALYTLTLTYTDGTKASLLSAERTA